MTQPQFRFPAPLPTSESTNEIPKRFFRIWFGPKDIDKIHESWWQDFQTMHPTYDFLTFTDWSTIKIPDTIIPILKNIRTWAGESDVARMLVLYQIGGIYIDTDVMPLRPFDDLVKDGRPFLARRSGISFEIAVIGSPKGHPAFLECIKRLPEWFYAHPGRAASVQTGPAFFSSVLFGRMDINHLTPKTFYPYNGFLSPKRDIKVEMFSDTKNFPSDMICAHFSNSRWGGKGKVK